jgi:hypothetical protein
VPDQITAEELARFFHEEYERLAPLFGWETQFISRKPYEEVPEANRLLMEAVCGSVLTKLFPDRLAGPA